LFSSSRLAWGAWIEIIRFTLSITTSPGRASHGARGLKLIICCNSSVKSRRASHGARGLKYRIPMLLEWGRTSRLAWGAWIEIYVEENFDNTAASRLAWGAWIEIIMIPSPIFYILSRLAWGAWIEIYGNVPNVPNRQVAPRMGRVD